MTLEGKVAFITGAGSGIGRGTAERLAREGADICIADFDEAGAEETASIVREFGRRAVVTRTNVVSRPQIQDAADRCVEELGRLDIAVCNAGIARGGTLLEIDLKDWQDIVDINLTGVMLTAQAAAQRMVKLGNGGRIVAMSSMAALSTGAGSWAYSTTKVGVRMMVRGWAQELGKHGITVNAIGPGIIETPLARALAGSDDGPIREQLEESTPVGRVGRPADIAGLIAWLAGPDADFMTGSYLLMDGGVHDSRRRRPAVTGADSDDPATLERADLTAAEQERRDRMQLLIDDR
jgi:NAD(P)-dependent dehydrogenase (short-subunit alcohol dehydrogenase family)